MSDSENKGFKRPKGDVVHTLAKAGLSAIPLVGGPAAELMNLIWQPALSKRRDEWLKDIAENLKALEEKVEGFKLENLANNETFITISTQASQAAIRSHQKEKLDALRNAVLNSALAIELNEEIQLLSVSLIERITVSHIKTLRDFSSFTQGISINMYNRKSFPKEIASTIYYDRNKGVKRDATDKEYAWKKMKEIEFIQTIVEDLNNLGLTRTKESPLSVDARHHMFSREISYFGKQFLEFISTPDCLLIKEQS